MHIPRYASHATLDLKKINNVDSTVSEATLDVEAVQF